MATTTKSGSRVGDWFLWIECEIAKTDDYRKIPIVTLREARKGGGVLSTVVGTRGMAAELRYAAERIEEILATVDVETLNEAECE